MSIDDLRQDLAVVKELQNEIASLSAERDALAGLIEEVIEAFASAPLGEWDGVGAWMNRAKIIGEKAFNEAFDRGRRAGKEGG
jgi:hypothetical protein